VTGAALPTVDLALPFRDRCGTFDRWDGKIAKRIGTGYQLSSQLSVLGGSLAELLRF